MPQKRNLDGSIRMSDDVDSSSILVVRTLYHMFVLDIKDKNPVLLKTIDFVKDKVPLSMAVMKLDKQLFMFGGEVGVKKYIRDTGRFIVECDINVGSPPFRGMVKDVYKFIKRDDDEWSLEITTEIDKPMWPKINPTVAEVHGKIFVLQGCSVFRSVKPHSNCEIYDPNAKTWKPFPEIPPVVSSQKLEKSIRSFPTYCFVGRRMYFQLRGSVVYCFNCFTGEWEEEKAKKLRECLDKFYLPFPGQGLSFGDNIYLHCFRESVAAYYFNDSGFLVCYQILPELTDKIIGSNNRGMSLVDLKIRDGRMCLITLEPKRINPGIGHVNELLIRHFKLKVTNLPAATDDLDGLDDRDFLEVEIINDQRCILPDSIEDNGFVSLLDGFFI